MKFEFKTFSFKCLNASNYIVPSCAVLKLEFYNEKMTSYKRKERLSLSKKYKVITEVESRTKPSKTAEI